MVGWQTRLNQTIAKIVEQATEQLQDAGQLELRVSLVAYRSLLDRKSYEVFPFSNDIDAAKSFLNNLKASGVCAEHNICGAIKLCLM